ncbi:hypothetical protein B0T18DRAFT_410522 [Schizothecium vesticola]|uniref:Uncharacterized protein n=1 Tax=Schizothecium vesticola TaxID=314040 RepID=A0AA40EUT0_9PEZI|nr:hypothetical protein B0T18DRAFT_410522 [Schizothecium vesticola]
MFSPRADMFPRPRRDGCPPLLSPHTHVSPADVRAVLYRCFISTSAAPSPPPDMAKNARGLDCVPPCRQSPCPVYPQASRRQTSRCSQAPRWCHVKPQHGYPHHPPRPPAASKLPRASFPRPGRPRPLPTPSLTTTVPRRNIRRLQNSFFMRPPAAATASKALDAGGQRRRGRSIYHHRDGPLLETTTSTP